MEILQNFKVMGILFAIIGIGFLLTRLKKLKGEDTKVISNIVIYLSSPALIFNSVLNSFDKEFILQSVSVPLFAIAMNLILIGLSFLVARIFRLDKKTDIYTFSLSVAFSNCVFVGLPIILGLYGDKAMGVIFLFDMGATLIFWGLGTYFLNKSNGGGMKVSISSILNPPLIAFLLAMLFGFMDLKAPGIIMELTGMVGQVTIPLSLLSIGIIIGSIDIDRRFIDASIILLVLLRLIISPALMLFAVMHMDILPLVKRILVMEAAMPTIVMLTVLTRKHGYGYEYASIAVFMTTLCSIITLPLVSYLVEVFL